MRPIAANSTEGRLLIALRAGPITHTEIAERLGSASGMTILTRLGFISLIDGYYRLTEAGRAACPYRNPLAAPGVVPAARYQPEIEMSREPRVTRQQVLAVIKEAGTAGISKKALIAKFDHLAHENAITSHLVMLKKDMEADNPSLGIWVATDAVKNLAQTVAELAPAKQRHATREEVLRYLDGGVSRTPFNIANGIGCTEDSTKAVLAGLFAGMKVDRAHNADHDEYFYFIGRPAAETPAVIRAPKDSPAIWRITEPLAITKGDILPGGELEVVATTEKEVASALAELVSVAGPQFAAEINLGAPAIVEDVLLINPDDVEFAIFSSGGLDIYCEETTVTLNKEVLNKLRSFLGLFVGEPA